VDDGRRPAAFFAMAAFRACRGGMTPNTWRCCSTAAYLDRVRLDPLARAAARLSANAASFNMLAIPSIAIVELDAADGERLARGEIGPHRADRTPSLAVARRPRHGVPGAAMPWRKMLRAPTATSALFVPLRR